MDKTKREGEDRSPKSKRTRGLPSGKAVGSNYYYTHPEHRVDRYELRFGARKIDAGKDFNLARQEGEERWKETKTPLQIVRVNRDGRVHIIMRIGE